MNINKYISNAGYSSRRQADRLIKAGVVQINGKLAKLTDKVNENDEVFVSGQKIIQNTKKIYLAFNKPVGVISTTDEKSPNNIMDYIKIPERVYPVGRLDVKTSGLILLTNDGELTNEILKSKKVEKEYFVKVNKNITDGFLAKLRSGINIDGYPTLPAKVKKFSNNTFNITLLEGRKRQIRRMCERFKYEVTELKRIRIGKINIESIAEKKYITIPASSIRNLLGLGSD